MDIRASIEKLINIHNPGMLTRLLLLPLSIAAFFYSLIVSLRARLYQLNILKSVRISCRVITVGNITVGGTGKTPTVCYLAQCLKNKGLRAGVLCRGYRGTGADAPLVVSDGSRILTTGEAAGDEAFMLAQKLSGIPVIAGKDRVSSGRMAAERFSLHVAILDDGFQHHRLQRDLDIVLINAANPFGNGFLLPRGTLREPLAALQRARIILLTKADAAAGAPGELESRLRLQSPAAEIFKASYRVARLYRAGSGVEVPVDSVKRKQTAGLCSIGDPASFFALLERTGACINKKIIFPDHHAYLADDYKYIQRAYEKADFVITTEKDIAKIDLNMLQEVSDKLIVMEIEQVIENEEKFFMTVCRMAGLPADTP